MNTADVELLHLENEELAGQIKRLIKAETKLYAYQEQLDSQLKEYKGLYELNRRLIGTFSFQEMFQCACEYVINVLEYERVLILLLNKETNSYTVNAIDGYYDPNENDQVAGLALGADAPLLGLISSGNEYLICTADHGKSELADFRRKFAMHEFLVYPLGSQALPLAILVIGNSLENCRFYHRINECEGSLLGVGNLVGLLSSSIENRILYEDMNKALELVKLAEAKYRNIFENAAEGIFQTTVEGRFISCNPATAKILGYDSPEELITGTSDIGGQLYVHPRQRSELLEILQCQTKIKNFEVEFYRKDGKKQWTLLSVHASFDNQGEMTYLNGIMLDIAERKRVEELIRSSLREKELLLREIHHRVKNNLQIITTLLDLQSMSASDSTSRRVFRECQDRIRSIALIHEKLYETADFVSIVFADYLENLVMHLMEMYIPDDRLSLEIEASDIILGIDDAIPCGLIVNELVTNSFKYAFPYKRKGELKVIMGIGNDDLVTLHVADNGPGLPPGLDFRNTETLGLQLVNLLVKQLKGRLELKDGPGTAFDIIFQRRPAAKER